MAADSATTVTRWVRGESRRRYFKSTNKIFNLSTHNPVGLMIYGAGYLQGLPWDVIIKSFRDHIGAESKKHLGEFAQGLFSWVESNKDAYPDEFRENQFLNEALESAQRIVQPAYRTAIKVAKEERSERRRVLKVALDARLLEVEADTYLANATAEDVESALTTMKDRVVAEIEANNFLGAAVTEVTSERLAEAAVRGVFKKQFSALERTGVVLGGYGDKDYFPCTETYNCYGNVLDKVIYEKDDSNCRSIDQSNVSEILPFARSEMIKTFMYGASLGGLVEIDHLFVKSVDAFEDGLLSSGALNEGSYEDLKARIVNEFSDSVTTYFSDNHSRKLKEVVGLLPIEDLALLAETLVLTESLKERVTTDEETVGGPIDVAIISKDNGFIWIKRKHYFEAELNPRYFTRLNHSIGDGK